MKIYTRTGDKGQTSLFSGNRVNKNDPIVEALGAIDECNCAIGVAIAFLPSQHLDLIKPKEQLTRIQHTLFDLGASVATPQHKSSEKKLEKTRFDHTGTTLLENWIDQMEENLPPLKNFILPGGDPSGANLHLARGLCRRAERCVIPLQQAKEISDEVVIYLNRLSDYLFMASRYVNYILGRQETTWQQHLPGNE